MKNVWVLGLGGVAAINSYNPDRIFKAFNQKKGKITQYHVISRNCLLTNNQNLFSYVVVVFPILQMEQLTRKFSLPF